MFDRQVLLYFYFLGLFRKKCSFDTFKDHSLGRFLNPFIEIDIDPCIPEFVVVRPLLCICCFREQMLSDRLRRKGITLRAQSGDQLSEVTVKTEARMASALYWLVGEAQLRGDARDPCVACATLP